jgi:hypothetical protein
MQSFHLSSEAHRPVVNVCPHGPRLADRLCASRRLVISLPALLGLDVQKALRDELSMWRSELGWYTRQGTEKASSALEGNRLLP